MRVTAVKTTGVLAKIHLGIDAGPTTTPPLCGCTRPGRTTAIEAANCVPCIARAQELKLNVEGLVAIPERVRRLTNAARLQVPAAARFTNVELAGLIGHCHTTSSAVALLRSLTKGS